MLNSLHSQFELISFKSLLLNLFQFFFWRIDVLWVGEGLKDTNVLMSLQTLNLFHLEPVLEDDGLLGVEIYLIDHRLAKMFMLVLRYIGDGKHFAAGSFVERMQLESVSCCLGRSKALLEVDGT